MIKEQLTVQINFGSKVRSIRKTLGISQESLAGLSGLDRSYIGGVERGERNISLGNIEKIAQALDLSIKDLFEND